MPVLIQCSSKSRDISQTVIENLQPSFLLSMRTKSFDPESSNTVNATSSRPAGRSFRLADDKFVAKYQSRSERCRTR